jgi:hypothetical protein
MVCMAVFLEEIPRDIVAFKHRASSKIDMIKRCHREYC